MKNRYCTGQRVVDPDQQWAPRWGAPLQKLFVGSSGKQCASIEVRCNDKYNWFKLFFTVPIDRENPDRKLCSVLFESRWILIFSEDRLTD